MGKYVVKSGGTSFAGSEKVIYYLPLTSDLQDLSGYKRNTVYEGETQQTITTADGLYLYKNKIILDDNFLNDVKDDYFSISFDIKINDTGTTDFLSTRYLMTFNTDYLLQITDNKIEQKSIKQGDNNTLFDTTINDTLWHHIDIFLDRATKDIFITLDNRKVENSILIQTDYNNFSIGHLDYGVNGYIKELKICTGFSKKYVKYFKDGAALRSLGLYYKDTTWSYVSTTEESTAIYKGVPLNKYIKITSTTNAKKGISFYINQLENVSTYLHIVVSGEINFDMAYIYIDDKLYTSRTGGTVKFRIKLDIPVGYHKVSVTYGKDSSRDSYSDCIWLYSLIQYKQEPIIQEAKDKLPYHKNIIGWFDSTTLDNTINLWKNKIDLQASIKLNNQIDIEKNSLKFIGGDLDDFACSEPKTIYLICKTSSITTDACLIGLKRQTLTDYTNFSIFETTSQDFKISQQGDKNILIAKPISDYCCIAITRTSNINSSNENGILIFIDGFFAGTLTGNIYGNYNGAITLLRAYDPVNNNYTDILNSPIWIKTLICSNAEHSVNEIIENSKFLMNKYMS